LEDVIEEKKLKKIEPKFKTVCRDEKLGRCTRRKKCCHIEDGKSQCHYRGAAFRIRVGLCAKKPKLTRKVTRKCHIRKVAHCTYQNKCCATIVTCRGKRCSTKKNLCI